MSAVPEERLQELVLSREDLVRRVPFYRDGIEWCVEHTAIVDEAVRIIFHNVSSHHQAVPSIAVVATGGYGRRELAPYSDVDITVIPLDEASPNTDAVIRELFQEFYRVIGSCLGLEVSYAYRLVNDAPALDEKTRTGLLDARLVAGSHEALDSLLGTFWDTFPTGEFLLAKIRERNASFGRYNDTPLVVEPQLKEGAGGLRSFQCANWIRAAIGERAASSSKAYSRILHLRNLLQHAAGKRQDVLSRQRQSEIADLLAVDLHEMMSSYARSAMSLHEEYSVALERLHETRFSLGGGVLAIRGEARILGSATISEAAAGIALATKLGLKVPNIPTYAVPAVNGPAAVFALGFGEETIRNLDKCGILQQLIPELESCKTLMPRDSAHKYTVFEHTMRVIRHLDNLPSDTFLGDLKKSLSDHGPLYLAALLHDVGKIEHQRSHSEAGADIARRIVDDWKLNRAAGDLVVWLVREHLQMERFIRMRDVHLPSTVEEFLEVVTDRERLDMLTLLTWADINSVNDEAWSQGQEVFLKELYWRTAAAMETEEPLAPDAATYRKKLLRDLRKEPLPEDVLQRFVESLPAHYMMSTPAELVKVHIHYVEAAQAGKAVVELYEDAALGTEVTVCCLDRPGLLSILLGVIYAFDLSVQSIRASTTMTDPAVALDVFTLSFGGRAIPAATANNLTKSIQDVLSGDVEFEDVLLKHGKDPDRKQQTFTYTFLEGQPSILEIQAPRGRGMPFRISRVLAGEGWNITAARVGQWAGRGTAAFYVVGSKKHPLNAAEIDRVLSSQV